MKLGARLVRFDRFEGVGGAVALAAIALSATACLSSFQMRGNSVGAGGGGAAHAAVPVRGKVAAKGRARVTEVVAMPVRGDKGRPVRTRVAADGSFELDLPRGHRYEVVYQNGKRRVGELRFPAPRGGASTTILALTQNVNITNQQILLGDVTVNGDGWAAPAIDPYDEIDSDGDGQVDDRDTDGGELYDDNGYWVSQEEREVDEAHAADGAEDDPVPPPRYATPSDSDPDDVAPRHDDADDGDGGGGEPNPCGE